MQRARRGGRAFAYAGRHRRDNLQKALCHRTIAE